MKKQNLNNKLAFSKAIVTELNFKELTSVNGGTSINGGPNCTGCCCQDINIKIGTIDTNQTGFPKTGMQ